MKIQEVRAQAKTLGIKVYTIGVGSTGLAPVWAQDMFGRRVIARMPVELDEEFLTKIAETTGGQYFNVRNRDGLEKALNHISKLEKTKIDRRIYTRHNELFPWALIPGLLCVCLGVAANVLVSRSVA